MNFDVIIIGGGLAGLTCGIALQQQGKRCAIVNNGQAAMDFSTGSMDLLARLPNGNAVSCFEQGFDELQNQSRNHPYVLIGKAKVQQKALQFEQLAEQLDLGLIGSVEQNHQRLTALGGLRSAWLSPNSVPTLFQQKTFDYRHIAILGIEGYQDFQPQLLAANLAQQTAFSHCKISTGFLSLPELDALRQQSREFRSVHIAQALERADYSAVKQQIIDAAQGANAVFLPACFGGNEQEFFARLQQDLATDSQLTAFELPTLPPSMLGGRQREKLRQHFEKLGGMMLNGDKVVRAEFDHNGNVSQIFTQVQESEPLTASHFVLAAGSFFSKGLTADFDQIHEPIFGCDIVGEGDFQAHNRLTWTTPKFAESQPYQSAGVAINARCQVQKSGRFSENLFAIGSVLGGFNPLALGCGSGVAIVTALVAAEQILGGEVK